VGEGGVGVGFVSDVVTAVDGMRWDFRAHANFNGEGLWTGRERGCWRVKLDGVI
jgi:hypothetical protein